MDEKLRCAFVYTTKDEDSDAIGHFLAGLEGFLSQSSNLEISRLPVVSNLSHNYQSNLLDAEAIFLLITPKYLEDLGNEDSPAAIEFRAVLRQYESIQEQKRRRVDAWNIKRHFELFPVMLTGTSIEMLPRELKHMRLHDFTGFSLPVDNKTHKPRLDWLRKRATPTDKMLASTFIPRLDEIKETVLAARVLKNAVHRSTSKEVFDLLFLNLKEDEVFEKIDSDSKYGNYVDQIFVKIRAYEKLREGTIYLLIGRKGSGKSTLTGTLAALKSNSTYKGVIGINANHINLRSLYTLFQSDRLRDEVPNYFGLNRCLKWIWESFLMVRSMEILVDLPAGELSENQRSFMPPIEAFVGQLRSRWNEASRSVYDRVLYEHSSEVMEKFLDDCITQAGLDGSKFRSDTQALFTQDRYLANVFTPEIIRSFNAVLRECTRPILVTLDGFDTKFEEFRREARHFDGEGSSDRARFEIAWMRALVHLCMETQEGSSSIENPFYKHLKFCLSIPQDRFGELTRSERDSFLYWNRHAYLNWSGMELAILIRKRLEVYKEFAVDKLRFPGPEARLGQAMREQYPDIPTEIRFRYGGAEKRMNLFLYILRHTFWRPRDVLLCYAQVLAFSKDKADKSQPVTDKALRRVISEATFKIINGEFIDEYSQVLTNFESVIKAFMGVSQFLNYDELASIVGRTEFSFALPPESDLSIQDKIHFLFDTGFLGVANLKALDPDEEDLPEHAFTFNGGLRYRRFVGVSDERFQAIKYVIHPIFKEYLMLENLHREFVLDIEWKDLQEEDLAPSFDAMA